MSEVDEALESTRQVTRGFKTAGEYPWEMARVLGAEVERLQKVVADQALTIGTLKDENARLQAKLKWFDVREPLVVAVTLPGSRETQVDELADWMRDNPEPHDPDALDKHLAESKS